jgi:hypothetical protein
MIKRFVGNDLVRNLDKTNIIKFITKNSSHSTLHIGHKEKYVEGKVNTKFLGLQTDNHINWKAQIEQIDPSLHVCTVHQQYQSTFYYSTLTHTIIKSQEY